MVTLRYCSGQMPYESSAARDTAEALVEMRAAGVSLIGLNLAWHCVGEPLDLRGADFSYADLRSTFFQRGTDFEGASFKNAHLVRTHFSGSKLVGANFIGAKLVATKFYGADLTGAIFVPGEVPVVPDLDLEIYERTLAPPGEIGPLDMSTWHSCDTVHCLAGWAIHLAGDEGYALERAYGPEVAGTAIYAASTGSVPDLYNTDAGARHELERRARRP